MTVQKRYVITFCSKGVDDHMLMENTQVIKHDLQLIAQISSSSEEGYFKAFMHNLLELFSTDRRLLETRGSLIIRQLCLYMNTEKIYRTFAEIIDKEEVSLLFASHLGWVTNYLDYQGS